ncbi:cytochrome c peroxidase [Herbaspirillum sp. Sphag1AN]|uniref:cytochrome-c peroxidase n=1 Tax=unclassified Herbaspirillum TaxID=2624150 RepID=UPI0016227AA0|nr:cytochrome c peroxidase [Herbaspirillum sp. Sphag1AN]MBB3245641.1 cytochrome c peroxidase [Herbaspirillum sp. Sphag64]
MRISPAALFPFIVLGMIAAFSAYALQGGDPAPAPTSPAYAHATYAPANIERGKVQEMTALGRNLFFDPALSASGKQSCASCHSPEFAYGPPNRLATQFGGADLKRPGTRAAPSLRYLQTVPPFSEHFHDDDNDDSIDAGPTGGLTWDGRADSTHDQARIPLLSAHEMGNPDEASVAAKLRRAPYANQLRAVFGATVLDHDASAFKAALMALEVFQESPADFYPYSSKYDAYLRKQVALSPQEKRGLMLFNAPDKGNCASCHISEIAPNGAFPQFTDYGLIALGVPRNKDIVANANPLYHDFGLCGPDRHDFIDRPEYCGLFKTPTLRNVALRQSFFHNGVMHNLKDVLHFYVERDSAPHKWYPHNRNGSIRKFDDLLPQYTVNVNMDPPFGGHPGDKTALNDAEIEDVIAFLKTLTDGYQPDQPGH